MFDVAIIGGGAAGLNCAITLASANNKFEWAKDKKYLVLDDQKSDLTKAALFNVAGFSYGISGQKAIEQIKEHLKKFEAATLVEQTVLKIEGEEGDFTITTNQETFKAKLIVLATGMHEFNIEGLDVKVVEHTDVLKPNKIKLEHKNNIVKDGIYVAGLLSGVKTMYLIAAGDGCKVACDIFQKWTNKPAVSHDSIKDAIV